LSVLFLFAAIASPAVAQADDPPSPPVKIWFDGQLTPHPVNPGVATHRFVEGDTLTIVVDPTRFFPNVPVDIGQLAVAASQAPPELQGFPVVGHTSGVKGKVFMQPDPGLCAVVAKADGEAAKELKAAADEKTKADAALKAAPTDLALQAAAKKAKDRLDNATKGAHPFQRLANAKTAKAQADSALASAPASADAQTTAKNAQTELDAAQAAISAIPTSAVGQEVLFTGAIADPSSELVCRRAPFDWPLQQNDAIPYVCGDTQSISDLLKVSAAWSLLETDSRGATTCESSWTVKPAPAITAAAIEVSSGAEPPVITPLTKDLAVWATSVTLKPGATRITLSLTRDAGIKPLQRVITLNVEPSDAHSLVRVQGEILATNALRSVSFAVTLTPVSRSFFTRGPWGGDVKQAVFLSGISPIALLRFSGDDKTFVQIGGGLGIYMSKAFQFNGGFLFGTTDASTGWHPARAWFVGIALDPAVLSEAQTVNKNRASP
ncbi:MAG TPA: hypothetical protein VIK01_22455, partial [Polyangiaceae bacterium]